MHRGLQAPLDHREILAARARVVVLKDPQVLLELQVPQEENLEPQGRQGFPE